MEIGFIGVAIMMGLGILGCAIAQGIVASKTVESMARQPEMFGKVVSSAQPAIGSV